MNNNSTENPFTPSWFVRRWWVPVCILAGMVGMKIYEDLTHAQVQDGRGAMFAADMKEVPEHQKEAARLFYELLKTHPHEEIQNDLFHLIQSGEILTSFDDVPGSDVTGAEASLTYLETPKGERLTLFVSMNRLLMNPRMTRTMKQLVIYHEWFHAKELRKGEVPKWLVLPRDLDVPITEKELRLMFEFEYRAYRAECQLAVSMEAANQIPSYCPAFVEQGTRGLRLALLEHYYEFTPFYALYIPFLTLVALEKD